MSNAQEEMELDELKAKIDKAAEDQRQAAIKPSPEPETEAVKPETKKSESIESSPEPTPSEPVKADDDPVEWAKKKGYKSEEDMARALLQKERQFHEQQQQKSKEQPPQVPQWQPTPQVAPQAYPPPPAPNIRQIAALYPQVPPEDLERLLPIVFDAARVISRQERQEMETRYGHLERMTERNNEIMTLMQDPAFKDVRVQHEINKILDSDPSIFQRERNPIAYAYKEAVFNMGRSQLQQGVGNGIETVKGNMPPVTAGGGNGSMNAISHKPTESEMERWSAKEIEAYIKSNGKVIPKGK